MASTQRRFSCLEPGCGKAFFRSEHLSRHRLNHRPKQVYQCHNCPKRFVRKDLLQRHEKRHERGMWFRNSGGVVNAAPDGQPGSNNTNPESVGGISQPIQPRGSNHSNSNTPNMDVAEAPPNPLLGNPSLAHPRAQLPGPSAPPAPAPATVDAPFGTTLGLSPLTTGIGMGGVSNPLFFDSSAEVQALPHEIDWLFEGVPHKLSPLDTMGFQDISPQYSSYSFLPPAAASYPGTQPSPPSAPSFAPSDLPTNPSPPWSTVRSRLLSALYTLPPDILQSSFFYPDNLASFYDLYFRNYHSHFPILHRPTLQPAEAPPLLITSIVTLGATLAPDESHYRIATRIHHGLRWIVFGTGQFEPPAPLWCLQALLLIQAHEKMFSTRKHHEMAHIFHGAIITLMKRGTAYSAIPGPHEQPGAELEQSWLRWVSNEASKRTAFFAFIMDAQHTFLFGHACVLSAHDVQLTLPCADILWEQQTSQGWNRVFRQIPEPPRFLPTLKGLLAKTPVPPTCSAYSRLILLHGLFSVTAHLHARDLTTLGVGRSAPQPDESSPAPPSYAMEVWKDIIERAIDTWSFSLMSHDLSLSLEAARTLHHMAHVAIYTSVVDFHMLADAPPLLGTPLSQHDYAKAKSRVCAWSRKPESKKALYHCLRLVQETVFSGRRYRAAEDNIALRPWCLYHATLVLWAYGRVVEEAEMQETYSGKRKNSTKSKSRPGPPIFPKREADAGRRDLVALGAEEYLGRMLRLFNSGKRPSDMSDANANANANANNIDSRAYSHLSGQDRAGDDRYAYDDKQVGGLRDDDELLAGASQTRDLILFVRESLENCRWELLQEAYVVLGKLIGV